ncbi:MAG: pilus assembly protein [Chloroflexi bacterium]|nr:MAG: pilus assembly protein [Chloroflexota bacterium]TME54728.1 MAG: pilus assembly protein [Chloroflexota bacterium]
MVKKRGTAHAQALVEFAIALPILILLVAGVLELGRGYSYAVATSDAARDGARYVSGKTATTNGPGLAAMCNLVTADLAAVSSNISCPTQVGHAPPFVSGVDYTAPVGGQMVVAVYCGASANCTGGVTALYQSEVDVYVYYGFNDLNLLGGLVTISGSSKTTTSW